jgi:hypothetical protein
MSKRKKAITDYFMQSKKLNKSEDSMKTCQIMLFGVGIAAYPLPEKKGHTTIFASILCIINEFEIKI